MHYCTLLITKEFPTDEVISNIMRPYDEELVEYDDNGNRIGGRPVFLWDWYQIGGRYNGSLKLKIDRTDKKYDWGYYSREGRNKRLFHSYLLTKMKDFAKSSFLFTEEDYYGSMGSRDDFLYVDGGKISDLLNFDEVECYICIDKEGNAIARETWDGSSFVTDEKFDEKLAEIKKQSPDCFATILDIHD